MNDPTAHSEVVAIRNASRILKTYDVSGCEIYSSCEPRPMRLAAIYCSHIDRVYFAVDRHTEAAIEFHDELIYEEFAKAIGARELPLAPVSCDGAPEVFAD